MNQILKDLRHGVLNMAPRKGESKETAKFYTTVDSSYLYSPMPRHLPHLYDEPPFETDSDDHFQGSFHLRSMGESKSMGYAIDGSGFANGTCGKRLPGMEPANWVYSGDNVIMTRTAGDIQMVQDRRSFDAHSKARADSGVGVEVHIRDSARISNASVETSRSNSSKHDSLDSTRDDAGSTSPAKGKKMLSKFKNITGRSGSISASEEALSQSSDYEDQDDIMTDKRVEERRFSRDRSGRASTFVGRVKGFSHDVKKKISKLRPSRTASESEALERDTNAESAIRTSASSVESLPSGSGSSVQALTTSSSNRSSSSVDEEVQPYVGPFIGKARALVDYTPSPYDKDALRFKKGDTIDIISMSQTGSWAGMSNNRVGHFKFINVELITEQKPRPRRSQLPRRSNSKRGKPKSVEELLQRINLEEYISVFVLNGYENIDLFKELEEEDLDYLGISDPEHRAKILTAVELLHDYDSPDSPEADEEPTTDGESYPDQSDASKFSGDSALVAKHPHSPRDSGCYASNENLPQRESLRQGSATPPVGSGGDISQSESGIHSSDGMDQLSTQSNNLGISDGQSILNGAEFGEGRLSSNACGCQISRDGDTGSKHHGFQPNILPTCNSASSTSLTHTQNGEREDRKCDPALKMQQVSDLDVPALTIEEGIQIRKHSSNGAFVDRSSLPMDLAVGMLGKGDHSVSSPQVAPIHQYDSTDSVPIRPGSVAALTRTFRSHSLGEKPVSVSSCLATASQAKQRIAAALRTQPTSTSVSSLQSASGDSKSIIVGRKQGLPSKLALSRFTCQSSSKKNIGFKEPVVSAQQAKLKSNQIVRPVSETLESILLRRLQDEQIDLTQEPYTDKTGFCGIPPALVQRYAEEQRRDIKEVAESLDQVRISLLQQYKRQGVPNDFLADSCYSPVLEANYSSVEAWMVSVGLPMYAESLVRLGYTHMSDIAQLTELDLRSIGVNDPRHLRRLTAEIDTVKHHMQKFGC